MGKVIIIERDDFGDIMEMASKLKKTNKEVMKHIEQLDKSKVNKELMEELEAYAHKSEKYSKKLCECLEEAAEMSSMNERRHMGYREDMNFRGGMGERYNGLGMNERRTSMGRRDEYEEDDYRNTVDPRHGGENGPRNKGWYRD